jgi:hypothetical protein
MVTDESPATSGEDWRATGETCPLLLAFSGGRAFALLAHADDDKAKEKAKEPQEVRTNTQ